MVGAEILEMRAALGLSQSEFARLLGVDKRSVVRWEANAATPAGTTLAVLRALRAWKGPGLAAFVRPYAEHAGLTSMLLLLLRARLSAPAVACDTSPE